MGGKKTVHLDVRIDETHKRMLKAICKVEKMTITKVVEGLIMSKFLTKSEYKDEFYAKNG